MCMNITIRHIYVFSIMADVKQGPTMERDFSKVILTLENVLIPDDKLSPTPSMQDGLDLETETDLRILGCELIQTSGILLKLPQVSFCKPTLIKLAESFIE